MPVFSPRIFFVKFKGGGGIEEIFSAHYHPCVMPTLQDCSCKLPIMNFYYAYVYIIYFFSFFFISTDEAMNFGSESDQSVILWFLMIALGQTPSQLPVGEREMWLQQLMNHLKTIAFGRESTPSTSTQEPHQVI